MQGMLRGVESMQIMVTDFNKKLGIDNNKLNIDDWKRKLVEEVNEVVNAKNTIEVAEEVLDVIQVCTSILFYLTNKKGLKLRLALNKHIKKLRARGWKFKKMIVFQIHDWRE